MTKSWNVMNHFNSQPHKEADDICKGVVIWQEYFNSQPHKEADGYCLLRSSSVQNISTHSLTRRLTEENTESKFEEIIFQLTASQGG